VSAEKSFLVTGAQGCIGSWVVKNLVEENVKTVVYDLSRDTRRLSMTMSQDQIASVKFIEGDILDFERLNRAVEQERITHIIHLAGLMVPVCKANPRQGAMVNVVGTINIFESALAHREQVERIVYASSAAVFGPEDFYDGPVPTRAQLLPMTHYGVFKQCNEGNARVYFLDHGISSVGLRPYTVYGPGRDFGLTSDPTKAMKAAVVGRPYRIAFGGMTDMQFVDDTARTFIRCAEAPISGAKVYNVKGALASIDEVISVIERLLPQARGLITHSDAIIPIAADIDDSELVSEIGQIPKTPLEEGISRTINIFRHLQEQGRLDTRELDDTKK